MTVEEERARQSLATLRKLLPLPAYLCLDGHVAETSITEFTALKGAFKIGVAVEWTGTIYNPNAVGVAICNDLRQRFNLDNTKSSTAFGGWHRIRVLVRNVLYRLDEFLTTDVRRGNHIFNFGKLVSNPSQHETLQAILDSGEELFTGGHPKNANREHPARAPTNVHALLLPYMTTLAHYFKTNDTAVIFNKIKTCDVQTLLTVTAANYDLVLSPVLQTLNSE